MTQNHHHDDAATGDPIPFGREFWEERYSGEEPNWSGRVNPVLESEAAALPPGRALDIGCGEGADAMWLAARGWRVTGVDIAQNALDRAREAARAANPEAAARIDWERQDLTRWAPAPRSYDLVSAQFMHLPEPERSALFRALAAAVAPGGSLLIVGHAEAGDRHEHFRELTFTPEGVLAAIEGEGLEARVAQYRDRSGEAVPHLDAEGGSLPHRDVVVRAVRPLGAQK